MSEENWKRWGEADERGALNLIDAGRVRHVAGLVREGQVLSLAQNLSSKTPVPPRRQGVAHFMTRDGGDYAAGARRPGGFQFADDHISMPVHCGTHVDALCHAWYDDTLYNGFSCEEVKSNGAKRCGVEKMGPVVGRGLLLDMVKVKGHVLPDGYAITRKDLAQALSLTGASLTTGDCVLIRTGWMEAQAGLDGHMIDFNREAGIDVSAAEWLAEAGVALVGADNFAIEQMPFPPTKVFPVHQRLIRDYGIPLLEGLVLAPLAETAPAVFMFVMAPLPIVGGTGSPLSPIAIW